MSRVWPVRDEDRAAAYRAYGAWHGRTIADDAYTLAADDPDGELFLGEPAPVTAATLIAEAEALVVGLADLGIGKGDVVSFMIPNWVEGAAINLAAAMAGLVVNPIVPIYRAAETRMILRDCGARAVFIPTIFRRFDYAAMLVSLRADLPDLAHVITLRGTAEGAVAYTDLVAAGRGRRPALPKVDPGSVKMIMYTSGTTGRPKGVLHSHETLARAVAASTDYWGVRPGDTVLMPSPVTHVSGYSNGLERPFLGRTRTVLMESWNAAEAVALIDRHRVTLTVAATPFLQELIGAAAAANSSIPSFRLFACGGAAVPADTIRRANAAFALPCAFRVYGSSEAPFVSSITFSA